MLIFIVEAALRSLLMALAVWTSIRLLRVQAVLAQKAAWVLVLLAAGAMPLVMHAPWLALNRAIRIPLRSLSGRELQAGWRALYPVHPSVPAQSWPAGPTHAVAHLQMAAPPLKPYTAHAALALPVPPARPVSRANQAETPWVTRVVSIPIPPVDGSLSWSVTTRARPTYWANWIKWSMAHVRLWAFIAYLGIAGILLLRTLAGAAIALRLWLRARPATGIGAEISTAVRISPDLATPVTIGSSILLPADYHQWDAAKLRVVLAHEHSHVRQGDFYLQLLAAVHAAVFWFSPLGWWLKRKLTELGEALSDRAGLEQAPDAVSYAQVLLEFAAMPCRTPLAGVAMASTSNLSSRIERILNDRRFRLAFLGGRRHAFFTALLVPAALVAVVACIRIVPAVEAAQAKDIMRVSAQRAPEKGCAKASCTASEQEIPASSGPEAPAAFGQIMMVDFAQAAQGVPAAPATVPSMPATPAPAAEAPEPPEAENGVQAPVAPQAPGDVRPGTNEWGNYHNYRNEHSDDDDDTFSIVHENGDGTLRWNGEYNDELAKARKRLNLHGDYIWFEHDGKSYIVTDPAILAQANRFFQPNHELEHQQALLDAKQAELTKRMEQSRPDMAKIQLDSPEMKKQMAELNARLTELQSEKFKKLTTDLNKQINQEVLSNLQEKMSDLQSQIGEIQGQIGEQMGQLGEKQGEIGEEMGRIGEQMGKIGEEQGRLAEEAGRRLKPVLDQAIKEGKAKPIE
jgi:hypothetical protein